VVDEDALYDALHARRIAGAGLDVMVEEPPPADHPLFRLDNAFDNVQRVAAGRQPLWLIPELTGG
jgi:phosphoglycerate dehydrogenase-like enzyme